MFFKSRDVNVNIMQMQNGQKAAVFVLTRHFMLLCCWCIYVHFWLLHSQFIDTHSVKSWAIKNYTLIPRHKIDYFENTPFNVSKMKMKLNTNAAKLAVHHSVEVMNKMA